MKKYEEYKDSGIEWVGEVPENWIVSKLKYYSQVTTGNTPPTANEEFFDDEQGVPWIKPSDLNGFIPIKITRQYLTQSGIQGARKVRAGSVLIGGIGDIGKLGIAGCEVTTNQQIHAIEGIDTKIDDGYLKFLLFISNSELKNNSSSVVLPILTKTKLLELAILIPSLPEQAAISRYLDHQTGIIDELIAKKEKLIELLKEKRQAVINEAVTKGLDPNAKMKDSGIEWLGEVPEDWEVVPLKHLASLKGRLGWKGLKATEYVEKGFGFLSTPDIKNDDIDFDGISFITEARYLESPEIMLEVGDVLLVKDGSTLGIVNLIRELPFQSTVNSSIGVIRVNDATLIKPEFVLWLLKSDYIQATIEQLKAGQGVPHLFQKDIKNFKLLLPLLCEQEQIIKEIVSFQTLIKKIEERLVGQIEKLKEYRQSIISEAVTGKIDVRNWQPSSEPVA